MDLLIQTNYRQLKKKNAEISQFRNHTVSRAFQCEYKIKAHFVTITRIGIIQSIPLEFRHFFPQHFWICAICLFFFSQHTKAKIASITKSVQCIYGSFIEFNLRQYDDNIVQTWRKCVTKTPSKSWPMRFALTVKHLNLQQFIPVNDYFSYSFYLSFFSSLWYWHRLLWLFKGNVRECVIIVLSSFEVQIPRSKQTKHHTHCVI